MMDQTITENNHIQWYQQIDEFLKKEGEFMKQYPNIDNFLYFAAKNKNHKVVKYVLRLFNINDINPLLSSALEKRDYEIIKLIYELNLLPNNIIYDAINSDNIELIKYLCSVNVNFNNDYNVLRYIVKKKDISMVRLIHDMGGNSGILLRYAIEFEKNEIVRWLCENKVLSTRGLCMTVQKNNFDIVKMFCENGIDVNGNNGELIITSIRFGNIDILKYLLTNGADINLCRDFDRNAIELACAAGRIDIVDILCEYGADINSSLALATACRHNQMATARELIQRGARVNFSEELQKNLGKSIMDQINFYKNTLGKISKVKRAQDQ